MKKPNEIQRYSLGCVWFFLSLFLFSYNVAAEKVASKQKGMLKVEFFNELDKSAPAYRCSGTYVAKNVMLTAAHCLNQYADQVVRIQCAGYPWQAVQILSVRMHPKMDVAIAQLSNFGCNYEQIHPTLPNIGQQAYIYREGKQKALEIVSSDAFTFKVDDVSDCLLRGESGAMAYHAQDSDGETRALGILIAGQPTCPAIQTFLRFDLINEWLFSENFI